jgi:PAS domain S-box-containing protein
MYFELILNLSLLVAISVVSGFIAQRRIRDKRAGALIQGVLFGTAAVFGMLQPLVLGPGLIFDGRSVMLSLCSLFFGPWAAIPSVLMTTACRLLLGGTGTFMGVMVILSSSGIGLIAYFRWKPQANPPSVPMLYLLGITVHLVMLSLVFTLPENIVFSVLKRIGPPVILLYPLATILVGKILSDHRASVNYMEKLQASERKYKELIENANSIILRRDLSGTITFMNEFALNFFGYSQDEIIGRNVVGTIVPPCDSMGKDLSQMILDIGINPEHYKTNENENMKKNGTRVWVAWTNKPMVDSGGKCVEILCVGTDITERKRTAEALRERSRFIESIVNLSPDIIYIYDLADKRNVFSNNGIRKVLGYSVDEIREMGTHLISALMHPDDLKVYLEETIPKYAKAKDNELISHGYRMRHKNDNWVWLECSELIYKRQTNGMPQQIFGVIHDVTERKRTEEALRFERDRAQEYLDIVEAIILVLNADGCISLINQKGCRLLGYSEDELLGQKWFDTCLPQPEGMEKIFPYFLRLIEGKIEGEEYFENAVMTKKGELRQIAWHNRLLKDKNGMVIGVLSAGEDITGRKKAESAVRESQELLSLFIRQSPIFAFIKEVKPNESRVVQASDNFQQMIDISSSDMLGKTMEELFPADIAAKITSDDWKVVQNGVTLKLDEDFNGRNYTSIKFPIVQAGKTMLAGYTIDITERKKAEEDRGKLETQLRQSQKMEAIGQLAGGIAHDFNNMLSVINGYSEMLLKKTPPPDPKHDLIREINKAGERSAALTQQLLAFARKQTISPKLLDLNDTVAGMLKMLQRLIGENIELFWKPAANLWKVKMDPSQINQILANLLVNARDAISNSGKVTIETGKANLDEAFCQMHPDSTPGKYVVLSVADNGCGMSKETIEHIFEPFFTTKKIGEGTGLGLATVFGIVKQNNGLINVYSELEKGSRFKIYLPMHESENGTKDDSHESRIIFTGTETVLLVEDEDALLQFTKMILEQMGYTVLSANAPEKALELSEEHKGDIHILITDVVMPGMSGRALNDKIRAGRPGIKCLFISGYTADIIAHNGVLDPDIHFLEKPFTAEELSAKLREALSL